MDWIHCNNCFSQPGDVPRKKFSLTNCGHIFCFDCAHPQERKNCLVCQTSCRNVTLSPKMNEELKVYFKDPFQTVQKMMRIFQFQKKHLIRLSNFRKKQVNDLKNELSLLKEKLRETEEKLASFEDGVTNMGIQLMEYQQEVASLRQRNMSGNSPALQASHSNNPSSQRLTPHSRMGASENRRYVLKRPPEGAHFFATSTPRTSHSDNNVYEPTPHMMPAPYRSLTAFESNSPNSDKWSPQRDPYFREFKLPGDRGGPPAGVTALHRSNMSRQPLKIRKSRTESSNYSEYFKRRQPQLYENNGYVL